MKFQNIVTGVVLEPVDARAVEMLQRNPQYISVVENPEPKPVPKVGRKGKS